MKKVFVILAAITMLFAACNKENTIENTTEVAILKATSEILTKATLNDDFKPVWKAGDNIHVYCYVTDGSEYTPWQNSFTLDPNDDGKLDGTFKREGVTLGDNVLTKAIYPEFDSNFSGDGSNAYFHLQTSYSYSEGTVFVPMLAVSSAEAPHDLSFKQVGGAVKVTLKGVPASATKVTLTCDKDIAGWYTIATSQVGTGVISTPNENTGSKSVSFTFAEASNKRDMVFYFPTPAVSSPKFTISLSNDSSEFWSKTTPSAQPNIERGTLLEMPAITVPSTRTITVGVISYVSNDLGVNGYQVHSWGGAETTDTDLVATGSTEQKALGDSYWNNEVQTFYMYTAAIPIDNSAYKVHHNGVRWFGDDGDTSTPKAYIFNYSGDKAIYE